MMLRLGLCLLILPVVALLLLFFIEQARVDDCLAMGGSYDYLKAVCDLQTSHPFVPLMARFGTWINLAMLLSCLGLVLSVLGLYKKA